MKNIFAHGGLIFALVSCVAASQNRQEETAGQGRIDIEYLDANSELFLGKTVEVHGYVRAGFDGHELTCFVAKSEDKFDPRTLIWLNDPSCASPSKRDYKEGMATVRGVYFRTSESFLIGGVVFSSELKDASIIWDE